MFFFWKMGFSDRKSFCGFDAHVAETD